MKRPFLIGVAVVVALIACGFFVRHLLLSNEELASKPEWAALQIVEFQHRDKAMHEMEFVTVGNRVYFLVGIPVNDRRKKVWIMLNPQTPPYYKQLPVGNFKISKEDLERVLASGSVSSTVESCLKSHVEYSK